MQGTQEIWVQSLGRKDPWRRKGQPTPVFLPGEFQGQKSLADFSPWGLKESDMTEWVTLSLRFNKTKNSISESWKVDRDFKKFYLVYQIIGLRIQFQYLDYIIPKIWIVRRTPRGLP